MQNLNLRSELEILKSLKKEVNSMDLDTVDVQDIAEYMQVVISNVESFVYGDKYSSSNVYQFELHDKLCVIYKNGYTSRTFDVGVKLDAHTLSVNEAKQAIRLMLNIAELKINDHTEDLLYVLAKMQVESTGKKRVTAKIKEAIATEYAGFNRSQLQDEINRINEENAKSLIGFKKYATEEELIDYSAKSYKIKNSFFPKNAVEVVDGVVYIAEWLYNKKVFTFC